jgi:hypothetical protein
MYAMKDIFEEFQFHKEAQNDDAKESWPFINSWV